jgi:hypothetical protein
MAITHRLPKPPEGYRLDLTSDSDAPAPRRPDGTIVARFGARGTKYDAVERKALEDLQLRTSQWLRGRVEKPRAPTKRRQPCHRTEAS